eukprot:Plantae.Rhodophyta-Hildenbrandia_rubra.ctg46589.p1 GENE.Plantae.Rhodophyta-Hildenbrandia_rubra.ctg46589~~Plantae.Rhodophyta-Hildenbrandia_rubra.ctg46589.p1  ORF type:complete len:215 (-),score=23.00 Plantae.Rhodophyta-Hildenbrandia_rubra.ctg46589:106-750(-)
MKASLALAFAVIFLISTAHAVSLSSVDRRRWARSQRNARRRKYCLSLPQLTCFLSPIGGSGVTGKIDFRSNARCLTDINGTIEELPNRNGKHGWHVHQFGDISDTAGGSAVGGHYNPANLTHGIPGESRVIHRGDLGNLYVDRRGVSRINIKNLKGSYRLTKDILGRGLIIHALVDQGTQPTGDSGPRLAQCVLGRTDLGPKKRVVRRKYPRRY